MCDGVVCVLLVSGNGGVAPEGDGRPRGAEEAAADGPRAIAAKVSQATSIVPHDCFGSCDSSIMIDYSVFIRFAFSILWRSCTQPYF